MKQTPQWVSRLATAGLATVLCGLAAFAVWATVTTQQTSREVRNAVLRSDTYQQARYALAVENGLQHSYELERKPAERASFYRAARSVERSLQSLRSDPQADRPVATALLEQHRAYVASFADMVRALQSRNDQEALTITEQVMDPMFAVIEQRVDDAASRERRRAFANLHALQHTQDIVRASALIVLPVALLLLAMFWWVLRAYRRHMRREARALSLLTRQNELILNSVGEGICGIDLLGRITFINPAGAMMLGYAIDELIGTPLHETIQRARADAIDDTWRECPAYAALRDGKVHRVPNDVFWRKDGSSVPVQHVNTSIREGNTVVGAVIAFEDITVRQEVERVKNEFISVVSHELRTPLTSIKGYVDVLLDGDVGEITGEQREFLQIVKDNSDRLTRLINDILDIERIESGSAAMNRKPIDVAELMTGAADTMRGMAEQHRITLRITPLHALVLVDPDRIVQVVTNLLNNAFKFSPAGSTVWLTAARQGDEIVLAVKDQGRGIPADKLESVFDRFQQVDASDTREKGGTGLGLAIARTITQQHDGRLWVESSPGEGSCFSLALPAAAGSVEGAAAGSQRPATG